MRIDLSSIARQNTNSDEVTKGRNGAELSESPVRDTASLSSRSETLQKLSATASEVPGVREQKVAALARMVRNGTYRISSEQTAEALMSQMRQVAAA